MDSTGSKRLTRNILISLITGIVLGSLLNLLPHIPWINVYVVDGVLDIGGTIFVRILRMMVIPVVFVSLVYGTCELSQQVKVGRLAIKTIALYMMTTAIAISLAICFAELFQIGSSANLAIDSQQFNIPDTPSLKEVLINMVPSNPIYAMVNGEMLQIIIFSLLFGTAIARTGQGGKTIVACFGEMNDIVINLILLLMKYAPVGVFCLVSHIFARFGFSTILDLLGYFVTLVFVLLLHCMMTNSLLLRFFARLNPLHFFKKMLPAMIFAFSTSSSSASIPVVLETVKERLGVKNFVASFSIPLGATINMDGTAIMQGVATIFISHIYGIDIGLVSYLTVILMATLASVGTAGVPGVGLITLSLVLQQVGLPVEGVALLLGIDRLLDMLRTAVNITGDSAIACVLARSENGFDQDCYEE